jgi:phenylpropionate dioxygenase-like ring-hydroxylating dioxygenase large terminal subunit
MYPIDEASAYPRNQWYVAGTGEEFTRDILARRILDEPLVFYRTQDGAPVALWGLCPHRSMPFELGQLRGDDLVCGYHGFAFSNQGKCVSIPTSEHISPACRVKSYPLVERGPWVWIWMGDGEPDHALLPDASDIGLGADAAGWRVDITEAFVMKARAQLLIDNLLDLSHLAFVHIDTVGPAPIALTKAETNTDGGRLFVKRTMEDEPTTPFIAFLMPEAGDRVWNELITDFYSPGLINAGGPWVWKSRPDGSRGEAAGKLNFVHVITPESPNSTHYFGVLTRNFRLDDDELSMALAAQNDAVRREDIIVLEAIEQVVDRYGDAKREISVKADDGALMVRRSMRKLIAQEQAR